MRKKNRHGKESGSEEYAIMIMMNLAVTMR